MTAGARPTSPADVGDFFSPFFRVAFKSLTKEPGVVAAFAADETFETSNLAGSAVTQDSTSTPRGSLAFDSRQLPNMASRLEVESQGGAAFKFTLTLTPPYEDAIRILENRLIGYATLVKVQWGYTSAGSSSDILSGIHVFRNAFPSVDLSAEGASIVLSGNDLVSDAAFVNSQRRQWDRTVYSPYAIVNEIVTRHGITLDDSKLDPSTSAAFYATADDPPELGQLVTDWTFVRRLLMDHDLTGHAEGKVFKVYSMNRVGNIPESYRFLWRLRPETKRDIPIMTFNGNPLGQLWMPPEARGLFTLRVDPATGTAFAEEHDGANLTDQQNIGDTGSGSTTTGDTPQTLASRDGDLGDVLSDDETGAALRPRPATTPEDCGTSVSVPNGMAHRDERVRQDARRAAVQANVQANLTAPGMPDVFPPMIVGIYGTSLLFDGPYGVKSVKHSIGSDGYTMDIELYRHTLRRVDGVMPRGRQIDPPSTDPGVAPDVLGENG